jgi:hypothetical protein
MRLIVDAPADWSVATQLVARPDDLEAWMRAVVGAGAIGDERCGRSGNGWPMTLLSVDDAGDARRVAFYEIFEYVGAAVVRAAASDAAVVSVLTQARPSFADEVCTIEDLFRGGQDE